MNKNEYLCIIEDNQFSPYIKRTEIMDENNQKFHIFENKIPHFTKCKKSGSKLIINCFYNLIINELNDKKNYDKKNFLSNSAFLLFREKVINSFKDNVIIPQNHKSYIIKKYVPSILNCENIKDLCNSLTNFFNMPQNEIIPELNFRLIINSNLMNFSEGISSSLKYLLNCLMLNFHEKFNNDIQSKCKKFFLFSDMELGTVKKSDLVMTGEFTFVKERSDLSDIDDDEILSEKFPISTIMIFEMTQREIYEKFYVHTLINEENKVYLIAPFSIFKVTKITFMIDKQVVYLQELKENILSKSIFNFHYREEFLNKFNFQDLIISNTNSVNFTKNYLGESSMDMMMEYRRIGDFIKYRCLTSSISYYSKAINILKFYNSENNLQVSELYSRIGDCYKKNDVIKACEYYNNCLEIILTYYGEVNEQIAIKYNEIGSVLENYDKPKAIELYNKALQCQIDIYKEKNVLVSEQYLKIANMYGNENYKLRIYCLEKAVEIKLFLNKGDNAEVSELYNQIGECYRGYNNDKSLEYFKLSLEKKLLHYGEDHIIIDLQHKSINSLYKYNIKLGLTSYYFELIKFFEDKYGLNHDTVANKYNLLAEYIAEQKQFQNSIIYLEKSLRIKINLFGEESLKVIDQYKLLWDLYYELEYKTQYNVFYEKIFKYTALIFGEISMEMANLYRYFAEKFKILGKKKKAKKNFINSFQILKSINDKNYDELANIKKEIGDCSETNTVVLQEYMEYIDFKKKIYGNFTKGAAKAYKQIAKALMTKTKSDAKELFLETKKIYVNLSGEISESISELYKLIGDCYIMENLEKCIKYYDEAIKIKITMLNDVSLDIDNLYIEIGKTLTLVNSKRASYYFEESLKIKIRIYGEIHLTVADHYIVLGNNAFKYDEIAANEYFTKALKIYNELYGEKSIEIAILNSKIGDLLLKKNLEKAIIFYKNCFPILKHKKENFDKLAEIYIKLGDAYGFKNVLVGISNFEEALKIKKVLYTEESTEVSKVYKAMGDYIEREDKLKAIEYYNLSLQINKNLFGEKNNEVAEDMMNIGIIYLQSDYNVFLNYFNQVLEIKCYLFGEDSNEVAEFFNRIGDLFKFTDKTQSIEYYEKSLIIKKKIFGENSKKTKKQDRIIFNCIKSSFNQKFQDKNIIPLSRLSSVSTAVTLPKIQTNSKNNRQTITENLRKTTLFEKKKITISDVQRKTTINDNKRKTIYKRSTTNKTANSNNNNYKSKEETALMEESSILKLLKYKSSMFGENSMEVCLTYIDMGKFYFDSNLDLSIKYFSMGIKIKISLLGEEKEIIDEFTKFGEEIKRIDEEKSRLFLQLCSKEFFGNTTKEPYYLEKKPLEKKCCCLIN